MARIPLDQRTLSPEDTLQQVTNIYDSPTRKLAWPTSELYEEMLEEARLFGIPEPYFELFSGFRSDESQAALFDNHATQDSAVIAQPGRSAHRTGHAMDLFMGNAPGFRIDSSDSKNVSFIRSQPEYRFFASTLAPRYGLWELPSEPWHWECDKDCRALFLMNKYGIDGEIARQIVNYELRIPNNDMFAFLRENPEYVNSTEGFTQASKSQAVGIPKVTKSILALTGVALVGVGAHWYLKKKDLI